MEHLSKNGIFEAKIAKQRNDIIRARIQSRHKNSVTYDIWVKYEKTQVLGWYCTCKQGAKTIGTCSHIASVIWFLSLARYDSSQLQQQSVLYINSLKDAADYTDVSSDSTTDEEDT